MRVEVPIRSIYEVQPLLYLGVDIFYGGVLAEGSVNNRDNNLLCQFSSFEELHESISIIHTQDKKFWMTLNSTQPEINSCKRQIERAIMCGVDAFIVSDIRLIEILQKEYNSYPVVLSVLAGIQNAEALRFYMSPNIIGYCFERNQTIKNMERIIKKTPRLKATAFVSGACRNTQRICKLHNMHPCFPLRNNVDGYAELICQGWDCQKEQSIYMGEEAMCSLCALQELKAAGISNLKIEGRDYPLEQKLRITKFIRCALDQLEVLSPMEYEKSCRTLFFEYNGFNCTDKNCFYG